MEYKVITSGSLSDEQVAELTALRKSVLIAANALDRTAEMPEVCEQTARFYRTNLKHTTIVAYEGSAAVACGSICYYELMPTYCNPSGKCAYIMNIYTEPSCRKRGIASSILTMLVQDARKQNVQQIMLETTAAGRTVYQKFGFVDAPNEMILPVQTPSGS